MVVLINMFEVEPVNAEPFLAAWKQVSAVMERQPGFIRTRLHRALMGSRFVNVGEWDSRAAFEAALGSAEFQEAARGLVGLATPSRSEEHTSELQSPM